MVLDMVITLIVVIESCMFAYVQTHHIVYIKYRQVFVYQHIPKFVSIYTSTYVNLYFDKPQSIILQQSC